MKRRDTSERKVSARTDVVRIAKEIDPLNSRKVLKEKREPLADRKAPFDHFRPRSLLFATIQALAFTAAPILAAATPTSIEDEDEEEEENDTPLLDWDKVHEEMKSFHKKVLKSFLRIVSCTSLKRLLEYIALCQCSIKTSSRLLKDPAKSAIRKSSKFGRRKAAFAMIKTAAYANAVSYMANFLIEELIFIGRSLYTQRKAHRKKSILSLIKHHIFHPQSKNLILGHGTAFVFSSFGIALGSFLKPGWGSIIGGTLGDLAGMIWA